MKSEASRVEKFSPEEEKRPGPEAERDSTSTPQARPRGPDRRQKPTNPFSFYSLFHGRRRAIRRVEDRDVHYYVDRYGPTSVTFFLTVLALCLLDALITIRLLQAGGEELNPVMHFLLQFGEAPFLVVKFGATVLALLVLIIHKEYYLARRRFRIRHLMAGALVVYALLILYEFTLLSKI